MIMKMTWQTKKLGEISDFEGGSQPPKSNFIHEPKKGYVRFLQIRDFASDKYITYIPDSKKNRHCDENDILLGRYGASVGKILINKKGAYNVAVTAYGILNGVPSSISSALRSGPVGRRCTIRSGS